MRRVHEIEAAASAIVRAQFEYLVRRYGTDDRYRDGWANHNATHNLRVAWHAARGAGRLVETGAAPPESVAYALIAGIHHDHVQEAGNAYDLSLHRSELIVVDEQQARMLYREGLDAGAPPYNLSPDRERLSVVAAHQAMSEYEQQHGYQPMELFTPEGYSTVDELIMATQVVALDPDVGIVTGATSERPLAAAVSDADKSDLSLQAGPYRGLGLLIERNRESLAVPAFSDGRGLAVPRELSVPFLQSQLGVHSSHRYTLRQSDELFPDRGANVDQFRMLAREHDQQRMTWEDVLSHTRQAAATEPVPQRGTMVVRDPRDLIGDLQPGLRGAAPSVRPAQPLPQALLTDRDRQGYALGSAAILNSAPKETAVLPKNRPGLSR